MLRNVVARPRVGYPLRLDPEVHRRLVTRAFECNQSINQYLHELIERDLDQCDQAKK